MAIKLTVFNHAGGAGKTSLTRDVGYTLSQRGKRVLLIDLDPQGNLTSWLGAEGIALGQTLFELATGGRDDLPEPIQVHGLSLIPSQVGLAGAEPRMMGLLRGTERLATALQVAEANYDVVLIDSPPSLGQLAVMGALAADKIITPIPTRQKGLDALPGLNEVLRHYRQVRPSLNVALYVPTFYDTRRSHDREVLEVLRAQLSPLASPVPQREAVWLDSSTAGQPIGVYAPSSPVHKDILRLTDELSQALQLEASNG